MDHVGIVVDDLTAATGFFAELGLEPAGEMSLDDRVVDRIVGHEPANATGLRHIAFVVEDIEGLIARLRAHGAELVGQLERYGGYRLCYVRGPAGIIVELAERDAG